MGMPDLIGETVFNCLKKHKSLAINATRLETASPTIQKQYEIIIIMAR